MCCPCWSCSSYPTEIKIKERTIPSEGHDLTLAFAGPTVTQRFGHILQVGMVALNQCGEGIFGYIHALRDSLSQVALF